MPATRTGRQTRRLPPRTASAARSAASMNSRVPSPTTTCSPGWRSACTSKAAQRRRPTAPVTATVPRSASARAISVGAAFRLAIGERQASWPSRCHRPTPPCANSGAQRAWVPASAAGMDSSASCSAVLRSTPARPPPRAAPVASTTPSARAGEACGLRPSAPSSMTVSAPHRRRRSMTIRRPAPREAPATSIVPRDCTCTITISPKGPVMPVAPSRRVRAWARSNVPRAVATRLPGQTTTGGFGIEKTASRSSPSRPMELRPTATWSSAARASRWFSVTVLPVFLPRPTTATTRMPWARMRVQRSGAAAAGTDRGQGAAVLTRSAPRTARAAAGSRAAAAAHARRGHGRSRCPRACSGPCPRLPHPGPRR